ncbi:hypothetical protein MNB_SV-9-878 [hydrothermal vent metagenome]|uniref:Uncharacterized protein n=1 Tax=hydrothermal vent metagenome TaxID=652676 RepID=A0A1W1BIP4_9ZZZZ
MIKKLLILTILVSCSTTLLFSETNEDNISKENIKLNIEKKSTDETVKPEKAKIKLADVVKKQDAIQKEVEADEAKAKELEKKKPKRKLTLDEKRAILMIKKQKEKDLADKKAEALYQEALQKAIESVR